MSEWLQIDIFCYVKYYRNFQSIVTFQLVQHNVSSASLVPSDPGSFDAPGTPMPEVFDESWDLSPLSPLTDDEEDSILPEAQEVDILVSYYLFLGVLFRMNLSINLYPQLLQIIDKLRK